MTVCPECHGPGGQPSIGAVGPCAECRAGWGRAFSAKTPMRGTGPAERRLSDVTACVDRLRSLAVERAMDARNAAKPHWRDESRETLVLWLAEEVGELAQAIRRGTPEQVRHEAGDVAWAVAMVLEVSTERQHDADPTPPGSGSRHDP